MRENTGCYPRWPSVLWTVSAASIILNREERCQPFHEFGPPVELGFADGPHQKIALEEICCCLIEVVGWHPVCDFARLLASADDGDHGPGQEIPCIEAMAVLFEIDDQHVRHHVSSSRLGFVHQGAEADLELFPGAGGLDQR